MILQSGRKKNVNTPRRTVKRPSVRMSLGALECLLMLFSLVSSYHTNSQPNSSTTDKITNSPFPSTQSPCIDPIKRKRQDPTNHRAEVPQHRHEHNARRQLVRPVPVAQLQQYARPQTRLKQTQEETHCVQPLAIRHGCVRTQSDSP